MQCPNCHTLLPDNARFCNVCGASVATPTCPHCSKPIQPGQKFCIYCGGALTPEPPPPPPPKPPASRRPWALWLIPLLLLAAAVIAFFGLDVPGKLAGRGERVAQGTAEGDLEALWQRAETAQAAGAWQEVAAALTELRTLPGGPDYRPAEVGALLATACANLALQAEAEADAATAGIYWACVLDQRPGDAEAAAGRQRADLYQRGLAALQAGQYPQAIAAWEELRNLAPGYADVAERLYLAYVAYGDTLCAEATVPAIEEGRRQYGLARGLEPARPEAAEGLRACQVPTPTATPTPEPTPTPTPLPGPHLGVIADQVTTLRVRSGPGAEYFVLGKLKAGDAITITGRSEDAAWLQVEAGPGRVGWVSSEYVQPNYPAEAAPVLAAPPLPKTLPVADAVADFSPQQGFREWFYLISNEPGSLSFTRMPWDGGRWYRWCCDRRYNPEMRLSDAGAYPSRAHDVARLWVSPYSGQLHIFGVAHKEPGAGRGGNGVSVRIVHNRDILWEYFLGGNDTAGTTFNLLVSSQPGDEFYFIVSALGDDRGDNTVFAPQIELLHAEGSDVAAVPARWSEVVEEVVAITPTPAPALCFEPRLRHYEEHKGCCAEVAGIVYNRQGQPFGPRGAVVHIEGPPATQRYVRDFGVDPGGGYNITALSKDNYTIWLRGPNIRSKQYAVEYPDWAKIRIIVDFYQVPCW